MSRKRIAADGRTAEQLAGDLLKGQGLRIRARNYRTPRGEVDIIAEDGETLVFAEVRLRSHSAFGGAAASIDARKQQKLFYASAYYLQAEGLGDSRPCRFDAICATPDAVGGFRLEWIRDAFRPGP